MMIIRPVQPETLASRGLSRSEIEAIRARAVERLAGQIVEHFKETDEYIVSLPPGETENSLSERLMATGEFAYAEPDWICHPINTVPNDGGYWQQWHHFKVHSAEAWDLTTGSPSLIIAIVDGGIELTHPDLAGALVPGYNAEDRITQAAGGDVSDVDGHGTFVSGIAGAIGNNGTHTVGMGWSFSIMPVRYYNNPGGGYLHNLLFGARWAADNGARCVSVSQTGVEYSTVQTTGTYVRAQGSLLFYAAGNDGRDLNWFDWSDVIIVGSTDSNDNLASFSAYGLALDVLTPGVSILSTGIPGALALGSGTSCSAPMAAGICGLVWSLHPSLGPDAVEQSLFGGCVDLGAPGDDAVFGHGRVDSFASVGLSVPAPVPSAGILSLAILTSLVLLAGLLRLARPR
ncbi:MAG: S8 family serine peptidase [Planctomycetota bacterium]